MMPKNVFSLKMSARIAGIVFGTWNHMKEKRIVHDQDLMISVLSVQITITTRQD